MGLIYSKHGLVLTRKRSGFRFPNASFFIDLITAYIWRLKWWQSSLLCIDNSNRFTLKHLVFLNHFTVFVKHRISLASGFLDRFLSSLTPRASTRTRFSVWHKHHSVNPCLLLYSWERKLCFWIPKSESKCTYRFTFVDYTKIFSCFLRRRDRSMGRRSRRRVSRC